MSIYFIQCGGEGGPIKIGRSYRPLDRMRDLQVANPYPLALLADIWATARCERQLHLHLAEHRLLGEWFHSTDAVMEVVDAARDGDISKWTNEPMAAVERLEKRKET